jgi:RND family efflux transporter MFP subunit
MEQSARVYSLASELRTRAESAAWTSFSAPADASEMHAAWLALLAGRIDRACTALLLTREAGKTAFGVAAAWPDPQRDLQYLGAVARRVLERREGVVAAAGGEQPARADEAAHVGYPIELGGELHAAVVFDIGPGPLVDLQSALRQIHWASAWLIDHVRQRLLAESQAALARNQLFNDVLATALLHSRVEPSALAVANELAGRLGCDRVSVGLEKSGRVDPVVMSNTASFDPRSDLVRWLGQAMDEVLDIGVAVSHPAPAQDGLGAHAHADSARLLQVAAILSVPVRHEAQTIGVLTFERNAGPPFDARERELAVAIGVMLGPVWAMQRSNERGLFGRLSDALREGLHEAAGPGSPGLKLGAAMLALFLAFSALWTTDHRVSARTVVEGETQRSAVAPFEGFIAQALVRAGDTVRKGQPLARLDDRDLRLEHSRWTAEREQLIRRWQVAQAQGDRAAMGVLAAQIRQVEAQLALADERIGRAALTAPFDGIVVSGDLSQQIGAPVETGKLLFEIAPLEGYRVMLEVDDRDIARLALRQTGELVLSGLPGQVLPIEVRRIMPVAVQRDGRNVFAVEASITQSAPAGLRPGMEGIGKVTVGQRSLLWIWTRGLIDWLRLSLWSWWP